jgi:hypothetical protein
MTHRWLSVIVAGVLATGVLAVRAPAANLAGKSVKLGAIY